VLCQCPGLTIIQLPAAWLLCLIEARAVHVTSCMCTHTSTHKQQTSNSSKLKQTV
jgi:hypothetical protein